MIGIEQLLMQSELPLTNPEEDHRRDDQDMEQRRHHAAEHRRRKRLHHLGADTIGRISRALSRSIEYGLAHREAALDHAMRYARGLDRSKADRFVGMYVNSWTQGYGEAGRRAVQTLLDRAHAAGLVPRVTAEYAPAP